MAGSRSTLRFLAAPTDAGYAGTVSAGRVMEWIDKAGYACAVGWSGTYCVTAYVGNVSYARPVHVGDLVEAHARIVHTGRSSMHVLVTVASGDPRSDDLTTTTECLMVFVAVDGNGRPTEAKPWSPEDAEDVALQEEALHHADVRSRIAEAMGRVEYTSAGSAPRTTLRFLAAPMDVNWGGKVHGGIVMRWIDEAAHVVATRWSGSGTNTAVYTGGVRFYQPLRIGDLVEVESRLIHTGSTSMHLSVHVRSGAPQTGDLALTTHCLTVFVGLDRDGRPVPAAPWTPSEPEDVALDAHARELIDLRGPRTATA